MTTTQLSKRYNGGHGNTFAVIATYNPNEENDSWIQYKNEQTGQEYNCRLEAFLNRFVPIPD